jgi:large subunit ribosomal protein L17
MKKRVERNPLRENRRVRSNTRNLIHSLFTHGSVKTSEPNAKAVRSVVERLISIAKKQDVAALRLITQRTGNLQSAKAIFAYAKEAVTKRASGFISLKKHSIQRGDNKIVMTMTLMDFEVKVAASVKKEEAKAEKPEVAKKEVSKVKKPASAKATAGKTKK